MENWRENKPLESPNAIDVCGRQAHPRFCSLAIRNFVALGFREFEEASGTRGTVFVNLVPPP